MATATTIRSAVGGSAGSLVFVANTGLRDYLIARPGVIWNGAGSAPAGGGSRVAPTLVAKYEPASGYASAAAGPKTASVTVAANDKLVILATTQEAAFITLSGITGGGLTYTPVQSVLQSSFCASYAWTADAGPTPQTFTFSLTSAGGTGAWGFTVLRYSGSEGFGNSNKANATTGAATVGLTTAQANSAVVFIDGDWNAMDGTSRTWATVNGFTPTSGNGGEQTYFRDASAYSAYVGAWPDVGAVGAKTVGVTAPTGQQFAVIAVEVLGAAAGGGSLSGDLAAVSELSTARPVSASKVAGIGQVTVAESARAMSAARLASIGRVTEASTARALAAAGKVAAVGRVATVESARAVSRSKAAGLGRVSEGATSRPLTSAKARSAGRVTESHTARPATAAKATTAGRVTVSEAALAVSRAKAAGLGRVAVVESAAGLATGLGAAISRATVSEAARALSRSKVRAVGRVSSVDTARSVSRSKQGGLGRVSVADTARSAARRKSAALGRVTTSDVARPTGANLTGTVGRVSSTQTARALSRAKLRALSRVLVAENASGVLRAQAVALMRVAVAETARNVGAVNGAELAGQWGTDMGLG